MKDRPMGQISCEEFAEELERLPVGPPGGKAAIEEWKSALPEAAREHTAKCAKCKAALADLVETRGALGRMRDGLPEPGPWFVARVMGRIRERQKELEEQRNGVWIGVMRLAPRLTVFAALLLVVGGAWAFEVRRAENVRQSKGVEGIFESAPSQPPGDDVIPSSSEEQWP